MPDKPEAKSFPISRLPAGEKSPKDLCEVNFSSVTNTRGYQTYRGGENQRHRVSSDSVLSFATKAVCLGDDPLYPFLFVLPLDLGTLESTRSKTRNDYHLWRFYHTRLIAPVLFQFFIEIAHKVPPSRSLRVSVHTSG